MRKLIDQQAAIDAVKKNTFRLTFAEEQNCEGHVAWSANAVYSDVIEGALLELPSTQPEITLESAIDYLHSIGWMQNHDRILTESAQPRWIPCSERLPDEKHDVLMMFKRNMAVGFWEEDEFVDGKLIWYAYSCDGWFSSTEALDSDGVPIAWMPLPEPCKEEP